MNKEVNPINIFDFDGTLTTETWPKFWVWVKKFGYNGEQRNNELENALTAYRRNHVGDPLETFFGFFNDLLVENDESLTYEELMEGEKYIQYNPGVNDFIDKTIAKNYIVSGGLKAFLDHLSIAFKFDGIYGTPVKHNERGRIIGIGEVMTDAKKVMAIRDILKNNGRVGDDCRNVYYIGDGYSDATAMEFVHENGGKAIFVYHPNKVDSLSWSNNKVYELLSEKGIVDFLCIADYTENSSLFNILQRQDLLKNF